MQVLPGSHVMYAHLFSLRDVGKISILPRLYLYSHIAFIVFRDPYPLIILFSQHALRSSIRQFSTKASHVNRTKINSPRKTHPCHQPIINKKSHYSQYQTPAETVNFGACPPDPNPLTTTALNNSSSATHYYYPSAFLIHPIKPHKFKKINTFFTATNKRTSLITKTKKTKQRTHLLIALPENQAQPGQAREREREG